MSTPESSSQRMMLLCLAVQLLFFLLSDSATQPMTKSRNNGNNRTVRITKMLCIDTPYKYSTLTHCEMEQFRNGTVGLHISVDIPIVINYLAVSAKVFYKYTSYRPFMIDWTLEYCRAARVGTFNPTNALIMKVIEESMPDFYYPCPHGNRTYTIFWLLEPKFIPQTLPSGDYRLDIFYRDSTNTNLFAMQMYGAVRRQGIVG
uniref:MD-2-related lipid-recognition domain-containing protein n=1 Tax=Anopheles christyi TaxID=43041 RepID=A0A240PMV8_9DIPT